MLLRLDGLMERYAVHSKFGVKDKSSCGYNGTPAYISLSIHNGNKPCPFDEIESMVIISLLISEKLLNLYHYHQYYCYHYCSVMYYYP